MPLACWKCWNEMLSAVEICFLKLFLHKKKKKRARISPFPHNSGFDKLAFLDGACPSKHPVQFYFNTSKMWAVKLCDEVYFSWVSNNEILNMAIGAWFSHSKETILTQLLSGFVRRYQSEKAPANKIIFISLVSHRGVQNIQLLSQVKQG